MFVPARGLVSLRIARVSRESRVMNAAIVPVGIADQATAACAAIERHPGAMPQAMHPFGFGSACDGGPTPRGDIDLLVTVGAFARYARRIVEAMLST